MTNRMALSASLLMAALSGPSAFATSLYWDLNGATANTGTTSTGAWNGTNAFWNDNSTGTGGTPQAATTSADDLFFSSGSGYTSTGTVTISTTAAANSITFEEGTVTLAGTAVTLGAGGLKFNSGTGANTVSAPVTLTANSSFTNAATTTQTISGVVSGAFDLALSASSTGSLDVRGANTYSGTTTVSSGTVIGRNTASTNVLNAFGTGNLLLNGGTLAFKANGASNGSQNIVVGNSGVTMGSNAATIDVNNHSANTSNNINLNSLSLGTGQLNVTGGNSYALRVSGTTTLTGNATVNPTTANLSLVGVVGDGGNGFGITKIGTGTLTMAGANTYTGSTSVLGGTLALTTAAPSGSAGSLGNSTSAVLLGDTSGSVASALYMNGDFAIGRDIIVQGGNSGVATIGSQSVSVNSSTFSGGIALGSGGVGHDAAFTTGNFHTLNLTGVISGLGGISSTTGTSTSRVIISGNNTYSGGTTNNGVLVVNHNNGLGTGTVTLNGGALGATSAGITLANNQVWAGNFSGSVTSSQTLTTTGTNTISGGSRILNVNAGLNINGTITDNGNNYGLILKNSSTASTIALGGANTFGGGLTVSGTTGAALTVTTSTSTAAGSGQTTITNNSGSVLKLANALTVDSLNSGISNPTITGGSGYTNGTQNLIFTGGGGTGAAGTVTIGTTTSGVIASVTITNYGTGYTSAPTISLTSPGTGTGGAVTSTFGSSSVNLQSNTLTLAGTNASPATYTGVISGTNGNLIKSGNGTQILTGANTYTGSTTISGGILNISGTGSINSTSGVTVNGGELAYDSSTALNKAVTVSSGILSGIGSISGATTIQSGGTLAAGSNGVGTLTFSSTLSLAGTTLMEIASASSFDIVASSSSIAYGGTLTVNLLSGFTMSAGETYGLFTSATKTGDFTSISVAGTTLDAGNGYSATISGLTYTFVASNASGVLSVVAAVPEPSTYAAIMGAVALAGVVIRRRRRAA